MRVPIAGIIVLVFGAGLIAGATFSVAGGQPAADVQCGTASAPQLRTTLYFGLARPKGSVSEIDWQVFLRDEVTARFPEGLTAWEAHGQWRRSDGIVDHERSKVLLLVHPDTAAARTAVQTLIQRHRTLFDQESVLWETARVCVAS
jgi:hypothetical protein